MACRLFVLATALGLWTEIRAHGMCVVQVDRPIDIDAMRELALEHGIPTLCDREYLEIYAWD